MALSSYRRVSYEIKRVYILLEYHINRRASPGPIHGQRFLGGHIQMIEKVLYFGKANVNLLSNFHSK